LYELNDLKKYRAMANPTSFSIYSLKQIKRLTVARVSQVGHRAYGQWVFYLNGYQYVVERLKIGLEDLLIAQKDPAEELAPIMKVDTMGITRVETMVPFSKTRFAPDKHNVIRLRPFVRDENLWEIEIGQATAAHENLEDLQTELVTGRIELSEKYIAPWRKGLNGILMAMRGEF
jgi:hypothetical protein